MNRHSIHTGQDSDQLPKSADNLSGRQESAAKKAAGNAQDEYTRALQILKNHRISKGLRQAVEEYCQAVSILRGTALVEAADAFVRRRRLVRPIMIPDLVNLYIRHAGSAAAPKVNRKRLACLELLAASFPGELKDLDGQELQAWLDGLGDTASERVLRECRAALVDLFNWARRQRYWAYNEALPSDALELEKDIPESKYDLLVAADLQTLLIAARKMERENRHRLLRVVLLGGLAGLRYREIATLTWEDIFLKDQYISVPGQSRPRRVEIGHCLCRWLQDFPRKEGLVLGGEEAADPHELRLETVRLAQHLQITWPRNALRNTWIAHTAALLGDPTEVARQAGLESLADLEPYRSLVPPVDAQAWFSIVPEWCAISD